MSLAQTHTAIHLGMEIYSHYITYPAGAQTVHGPDAMHTQHYVAYFFFIIFRQRSFKQFGNTGFHNLVSRFHNKYTHCDCRKRIEYAPSRT